jgi:hypothetical protein
MYLSLCNVYKLVSSNVYFTNRRVHFTVLCANEGKRCACVWGRSIAQMFLISLAGSSNPTSADTSEL